MTRHVAEFAGDPTITLQAMISAGQAISPLRAKIAGWVQYLSMAILAPIGMLGLLFFAFQDFVRDYTFWVALACFGAGFGIAALTGLIYRDIAKISAQSHFAQAQQVEISPDGFDVRTRNSTWRSGWSDITAVTQTKDALCVAVSGVALYVPKAELDDPEQTFKDMQSWHAASVFA